MVGVSNSVKFMAAAVMAALLLLLLPSPAHTATTKDTINKNTCSQLDGTTTTAPIAGCESKDQQLVDDKGTGYVSTLVDAFIFVGGFVAFAFLIVGAIRYLTATGDPGRIQGAKDTVLYSIIGLILVALAKPIADFVINRIGG